MDGTFYLQLIFPLTGIVLLAISMWSYASTRRFLACAKPAIGRIVDNSESTDSEGSHIYSPKFSFTTEDGSEVVVQSKTGTSSPFRKGETVKVLYVPSRPQKAKINTFIQLWLLTVIASGLGLIFLIAGCILVFAAE